LADNAEAKGNGTLPHPSPRSLKGLDWFTFFVADVQTGFGPFISVYLTANKWTQEDIGLALSIGSLVSLFGQVPGGAIVDAARSERFAAALAVIGIGISACIFAFWPVLPLVFTASVLHAAASCVLGPAIVAISVGLVGHLQIGGRLGRNARFASLGNGLAAAAMGGCAYLFSTRAVFLVTAVLLVPTLFALAAIRGNEVDPERAHGSPPKPAPAHEKGDLRRTISNPSLIIFACCAAMFNFANAAMLPLMGSTLTMRSGSSAPVFIAACIVVPQMVVAAMSPWVGRQAERWGRRPLLLAGFAALPLRGLLFASSYDPYFVIAMQLLDGISAAVLGVLIPLVIVDVTRNTGRLNLAQGIVGAAIGVGATLSTIFAGYLADHNGTSFAFFGLAVVAALAFVLVAALMPETRPPILTESKPRSD
jgi:predicted MFS family arabinose efflux permease